MLHGGDARRSHTRRAFVASVLAPRDDDAVVAGGGLRTSRVQVSCTLHRDDDHGTVPPAPTPFAVFHASKDLADRADLYLARLDGSEVFRLNGPLVPGGVIWGYAISPDRRHVAYQADQDTRGVGELYVARTDGEGVVKVSPPQAPGDGVGGYVWAPDGSRLAYLLRREGVHEIRAVRADGTGDVRLSGPLVAGGWISTPLAWSPDGSRLAYRATQYTANVSELFTVRADGTSNVRVSRPVVPDGGVSTFSWSPDGSRLAYCGPVVARGVQDLFTVGPAGAGEARVSPVPFAGGNVDCYSVAWAPGGHRLAFRADARADERWELFTAHPDGSGLTLASSVVAGEHVTSFAWSPDGNRLAYVTLAGSLTTTALHTSGPEGEANVSILETLPVGWAPLPYNWAWSPDSSAIAYLIVDTATSLYQVRAAPATGGPSVRLDGGPAGGVAIASHAWAPDGQRVAYVADQRVRNTMELFTTRADGTGNVRVSGTSSFSNVYGFAWYPSGTRLVYRADQLVDEQYELFVAAPDGGVANDRLSGPLTAGGDVYGFMVR